MMYLAIGAALLLILLKLGSMVVPKEGMDNQAVLYALSTLAQTCAALAAFIGAVGLFRLQIVRDQMRDAEFEYRARVRGATGYETHVVPIRRLFELAESIPDIEKREYVAEGRALWEAVAPRMRCTIRVLVIFEAWILFVILISLGGLGHVSALACWPWSLAALWSIAIITVLTTGGALFVWLDVWRWLRRDRTRPRTDRTT
jgi:hypothetical protein